MMDWASDPHSPGSGVAVVQRLLKMFDFMYAIGGTEMTRKVLPAFGFAEVTEAWFGARPLRPFRQVLDHPIDNWKFPARLARNTLWSLHPRPPKTSEWRLAPADLNQTPPALAGTDRIQRSNAFFRYLQACPISSVTVYDLEKDGLLHGRLALSAVGEQSRVLGVWPAPGSVEALAAACTLVQAAASPSSEIVIQGSTRESKALAIKAGFRI